MSKSDVIPVTILTGYLGAGKTTLLNRLLTDDHGYKCAVIINEFGAAGIDHQLVIGATEEIVELNNGCLCCRLRGDLVRTLGDLIQKRKRFDYVIIETTGLADPSPIAHTFLTAALEEHFELDAIVTVVDSRFFEKELEQGPEPQTQAAFADIILLNKTDLVSPADLDRIEQRLRRINPLAKIHRTQHAEIGWKAILETGARELSAPLEVPVANPSQDLECGPDCQHSHASVESAMESHTRHNGEVSSFFITEHRPLDLHKMEQWLSKLLSKDGENIYRAKGVLFIQGEPKRIVFQSVQMIYDAAPDRYWKPGESRSSQMVFIGKHLDEWAIRQGFNECVAALAH